MNNFGWNNFRWMVLAVFVGGILAIYAMTFFSPRPSSAWVILPLLVIYVIVAFYRIVVPFVRGFIRALREAKPEDRKKALAAIVFWFAVVCFEREIDSNLSSYPLIVRWILAAGVMLGFLRVVQWQFQEHPKKVASALVVIITVIFSIVFAYGFLSGLVQSPRAPGICDPQCGQSGHPSMSPSQLLSAASTAQRKH